LPQFDEGCRTTPGGSGDSFIGGTFPLASSTVNVREPVQNPPVDRHPKYVSVTTPSRRFADVVVMVNGFWIEIENDLTAICPSESMALTRKLVPPCCRTFGVPLIVPVPASSENAGEPDGSPPLMMLHVLAPTPLAASVKL